MGKDKRVFVGKAKDLTREVIARLFWNNLMSYTRLYKVMIPKDSQN